MLLSPFHTHTLYNDWLRALNQYTRTLLWSAHQVAPTVGKYGNYSVIFNGLSNSLSLSLIYKESAQKLKIAMAAIAYKSYLKHNFKLNYI